MKSEIRRSVEDRKLKHSATNREAELAMDGEISTENRWMLDTQVKENNVRKPACLRVYIMFSRAYEVHQSALGKRGGFNSLNPSHSEDLQMVILLWCGLTQRSLDMSMEIRSDQIIDRRLHPALRCRKRSPRLARYHLILHHHHHTASPGEIAAKGRATYKEIKKRFLSAIILH
ncbi:jg5098 [Pararge aegeria aegeria]|uniref:Jg5098 protein n=1 Tax=Pararge aegeria aegeria TaxID=348720 RepID=A0A8S4S1R3_9NEOP|nr:jg5098 [Pararge aegeria aegeria]